jgi:hypothetical protein
MRPQTAILWAILPLLLGGCGTDAPTATDATAWDTEQFQAYFGLSDEEVEFFIEKGIFDPDDTCTTQVTVLPQRTLPDVSSEKVGETGIRMLMPMLARLHTTVPELYIDTGNTYAFNYQVTADNLGLLLDEARAGKLAALCGEYAQFVQVLWQYNFPDARDEMRIASMNRPEFEVAHTVNLIYWQEDGVQYGLVADAMYGYVFPLYGNNMPVLLDSLPVATDLRMRHLNDDMLNNKRFLTDRIWPCNLVDPMRFAYHRAPKGALRSYELVMPENITELFPKGFTRADYERDLLRLLLAGRPR